MDLQVLDYLDNHTPSGDELFVLAGVAAINDAVFGEDDPTAPAVVLGDLVSRLAQAGAKHVLVSNGVVHHRMSRQDFIVPYNEQFNDSLAVEMEAERVANKGLQLYEFDMQQVISDILAAPTSFGITNTDDPACRDCGIGLEENPTDFVENPHEFFFWDRSHFTAPVNQLIGVAASRSLLDPATVGDFNMDGGITPADIDLLSAKLTSSPSDLLFDLNGDSLLNQADHLEMVVHIAGVQFGDADFDGTVGFSDFLLLSASYGAEAGWANGDFDGNLQVNFDDFLLLSNNFGQQIETASAVPEATSQTLINCALLVLAACRKRRDGSQQGGESVA